MNVKNDHPSSLLDNDVGVILDRVVSEASREPTAARQPAPADAITALRALPDDAFVDALHTLYRAGQTDSRRPKHRRGQSQRKARLPAEQPATARSPARHAAQWLVTATVCGAVIMSLELIAFRLYAPYFGYSTYVWGSMISVVMLALACGYALGGRLADRSTSARPLYLVILGAAVYQFIVLCTVHPLLATLSRWGEFSGTVAATLVIFTPSMTGLAMAGPFVIRLLSRAGRAGSTAGWVYALSTVGSIVGILLTSFFLVPRFGTQATLAMNCGLTALIAVAGLVTTHRRWAVGLVLIAMLPLTPESSWGHDALWTRESAYNLVRVVQRGDQLELILNNETSVASRTNVSTGWSDGYRDDFSVGPLLVNTDRVLVLGMGAGVSVQSMWRTAPNAVIDAVEIDPEVIEAGVRFFSLDPNDDRLRIHLADARPWVAADTGRYDVVQVDLYQGGPYVPFYLVTQEFFASVRKRMTDDSLLMMNVLDAGSRRELFSSIVATLREVFPTVAAYRRDTGSSMILAFTRARSASDIRRTLARYAGNGKVAQRARLVAAAIRVVETPPGTAILTDDHAPVEAMTRRMLLELAAR